MSIEHTLQPINELVVWEHEMQPEQAALFMKATSSETKALLLCAYRDQDETMDVGEINSRIEDLQGNDVLWTPTNAYYSEICRGLAGPNAGLFTMTADSIRETGVARKYGLSQAGYEIARPIAGQLLNWGLESNLALRRVLGEPKQTSDLESSLLARLAILKVALLSTGNVGVIQIAKQYPEGISLNVVKRHCARLVANGLFQRDEKNKLSVVPEHAEALAKLVDHFTNMLTYNPDWYDRGQELADSIVQQPSSVRHLIKRVEVTTDRTQAKRFSRIGACDDVVEVLERTGRPSFTSEEIISLLGIQAASKDRRYRLIAALRNDDRLQHLGENGDYLFSLREDIAIDDKQTSA
jgi:hypothetical protein